MWSGATEPQRGERTLVVGLGNPILGDDGVGWRVIDVLEHRLGIDSWLREDVGPIEIARLSVGGLNLMERLVGYRRVLVVDAVTDGEAGTVRLSTIAELAQRPDTHLDSVHDVTLPRAIELAAELGTPVPDDILVLTISIKAVGWFGEGLSPEVEEAVRPATDILIGQLTAGRATLAGAHA